MTRTYSVPSILVVDDSAEVRLLVAWALGNLSATYTLVEADSGKAAIELLAQRTFTVLIVDQQMPGITGLEVVQAAHDDPAHAEMPAVLLTSEDDPVAAARAAELGVHMVIRKPFTPETLLTAVQTAIADRPGAPPPMPAGMPSLQSVLDGLPYLAMIIDAHHRVVLGNHSYFQATGAGIDDCGLDCATTVHGEAGVPFECPLKLARESGKPAVCEVAHSKLGPLRVSVFPLDRFAPDGERLYLHLAEPIAAPAT